MHQFKYIAGHRFFVPLFVVLPLLASVSAWAAVGLDETIGHREDGQSSDKKLTLNVS